MTDTTTDTDSSGLTAAERAYFDSRGAKTDGLVPDEPSGGRAAGEEQSGSPAAPPVKADTAKPDAGAANGKAPGADLDPDEEPLGEDGRPKNPGRFIRFGAFDKERKQRQELERALAAEREARTKEQVERAKVAERLELLNAALQPQPGARTEEKPAEPPDPEKDIFGYVKWQDQRLADLTKRLEDNAKQGQEQHKQTAAQLAEGNLRSAYAGDAQRFMASTPDFGAAYQHLLQSRDTELAMVGHTDPEQRRAMIVAEEREIAERFLRMGKSPAEAIYTLAKARGYAPAAAPAPTAVAATPPTAANGNGAAPAAPAPAQTAAAAPSVTDEIARIKAGQDASKSLSQAGGTAGGTLSMEALASMPQSEFDAWMAKASKSQIRAVMGG
jgi:hypothetical protein